jgi:integrase
VADQGIEVRHGKTCPARNGGKCAKRACGFRASVWDNAAKKRRRKTFPTLAAAKAWRRDTQTAVERGDLVEPTGVTLREAADAFMEGARSGAILERSGKRYKPSALRQYEQALRLRVLPELGDQPLDAIPPVRWQEFVDGLVAVGHSPSTIRNTMNAPRAIYRHAVKRRRVPSNPTVGLDLPRVRVQPKEVLAPEQARALIDALPDEDRALWHTAFFAGLRLGELRALRWENVDLAEGVIHVRYGWDDHEGLIEPKSDAGRRDVPIPAALRDVLVEHRAATWTEGFVFGRSAVSPFAPSSVYQRADRAFEAAGLNGTRPHRGRHSWVSLMLREGVSVKATQTWAGHSTPTTTLTIYAHLIGDERGEAMEKLNARLARAATGTVAEPEDSPEFVASAA